MEKRDSKTRALAEHCRELAEWTSDERTQHILFQMARELEMADADDDAPARETASGPMPPSLS